MTVVNELEQSIPISRISRAMAIPRSFIYNNRSGHGGGGKQGYPSMLRGKS